MLNSIQLLRLIAALSVLFAHIPNWALPVGNVLNCGGGMQICGSIGVDLFFCISGFLMVVTTANRAPGIRNALAFAVRRIFRIWPLYALVTMAYMATRGVELQSYWKWLVFAPYLSPTGFWDPPLHAGWTLHFEMYFYALTAVCMLLPWKTKAAAVAVTLLGCASLLIDNTIYFTASIIVEFAFGIALGLLWLRKDLWESLRRWRMPILICSTALLVFAAHGTDWPHNWGMSVPRMEVLLFAIDTELPRFIGWGIPAALFALSVVLFEDRISRRAGALGDYTYSIYLLHLPVIYTAEAIAKSASPELQAELIPLGAYPVGIIVATLASAFLAFHAVERPTQRLGGALARAIEARRAGYRRSPMGDTPVAS
ncbi:acyltransferase [Cupriavidus sp. AU9028]|uniref:acyltransferase family protein n=1 Tax=Cupriavidus sp. AU9028 TaxID=2871157 RepID=UPI001C972ACE|nr:acyltransferase [Cupriavidus sp. AU9028]MBY4898850.1 acyltransferase [Cupriavidus sp. AU9028]